MTLLEPTTEKDLREKIRKVKGLVENLLLSVDQRQELSEAIRTRKIMVSAMNITPAQIHELNTAVSDAYSARDLAYSETIHLPKTNDCDEYARKEIDKIWADL